MARLHDWSYYHWLLHKLFLFSTGLDTAPSELQLYNNFLINKSVMRTYLQRWEAAQADTLSGGKLCDFLMNKVTRKHSGAVVHLPHLTARGLRVWILPQHIWLVRPNEFASVKGLFFSFCGPAINRQLVQSEALLAVIGHLTPTWPLWGRRSGHWRWMNE